MIDHQRFLGAATTEVLPYLGGPSVDARDRRLRVTDRVPEGWWAFRIEGRIATPGDPASMPDVTDLPALRGHTTDGYLLHAGGRAEVLHLAEGGDIGRFAPTSGRRWPSGDLLFEAVGYETGAEEEVRDAFDQRRGIDDVRGVPSTLRAAFAVATAIRAGTDAEIPVTPVEVIPWIGAVASGGDAATADVLEHLRVERLRSPSGLAAGRAPAPAARDDEERIDDALRAVGAAVHEVHRLGPDVLRVRYRFDGDRWTCVVRADTLQVIDAGICLDGEDAQLTIESLPSVIREARGIGQLTRTVL